MEPTIHPEALKYFRKKRGWSQKDLAKKCGCNSAQVSRWERGKSQRIRSYSRERLTKALGVNWEDLTRPPNGDENDTPGQVQINYRVKRSVRNALQLVCLRYSLGVRPADIISLAPLLFLIVAEKSLVHRQENLDAIVERNYQTEKQNHAAAPHLSLDIFYQSDLYQSESMEKILDAEQISIATRDIFGFAVDDDLEDGSLENPFLDYLEILMADIPSDLINTTMWAWESNFDYRLAEETLRKVIGIAGETEAEQMILDAILEGDIDLSTVLSEMESRSQEEYLSWLQKAVEAANGRSLASKRDEYTHRAFKSGNMKEAEHQIDQGSPEMTEVDSSSLSAGESI